MKKKISIVLLLIMVVTCGLTLIGCERQREVEIVLYHPITGEEVIGSATLEFREGEIPENTKVKFAIRDIKNGKLLTDEDLEPYSSLETCYNIAINYKNTTLRDSDHWPTKIGEYYFIMEFNCVDNTDKEYKRRYSTQFRHLNVRIGE